MLVVYIVLEKRAQSKRRVKKMDKNPINFTINTALIINSNSKSELSPQLGGNKRQRLNDDLNMLNNNTNDYSASSNNISNKKHSNINENYKIKPKKQKPSPPSTSASEFTNQITSNSVNNEIPSQATSFHFEYPQSLESPLITNRINNQLHHHQYHQPHINNQHHIGPIRGVHIEPDEEEDYDDDEDDDEDEYDEDIEEEDDFDEDEETQKQKRPRKTKEAKQNDLDKKASDKLNKSMLKSRSKKTKGRVKIKMEFIENKIRRYTTFSKRKTGIMKKAYELSTLTGTQVMLLVASETGHVYTFATDKLQPMITSETGKTLIQSCLSYNQDVNDNELNNCVSLAGTSGDLAVNNGKNRISIEFNNNDEFHNTDDLLDEEDEDENYEDDEAADYRLPDNENEDFKNAKI